MVAGAVVTFPSIGVSQTQKEKENTEARKLFNEGREFQDRGRLLEAEKKFKEALAKYPKWEQSDKTQYYLIDTLVKLKNLVEARTEVNRFLSNYPGSTWSEYVSEFIVELGGIGTPRGGAIWNSTDELIQAQLQDDLRSGRRLGAAFGPPEKVYPASQPSSAIEMARALFNLIQMDPEAGIETAKNRLKTNPSDPAVIANLGWIANTNSLQRIPLLLSIWTNPLSSPSARNQAFFWYGRRNPDKEAVAKAILSLLESPATEAVASEALSIMTVPDHRAVLDKVVSSSHPNKFDLMKKIYQRGSVLLRSDLLMFISKSSDPKAVPFLLNAAQTEYDPAVRRVAAEALMSRKDVNVKQYEMLLKAPTPAPRPPQPQPQRFLPQTRGGSNLTPLAGGSN